MNNTFRNSQLLRIAFAIALTVATGQETVGSFWGPYGPEIVITPETQDYYGVEVTIGAEESLRRVDVYMPEGHVITMANFEKTEDGQILISVRMATEERVGQHITLPLVLKEA